MKAPKTRHSDTSHHPPKKSDTLPAIAFAEITTRDASDRVDRASRSRLATYLRLSARDQLNNLHDPNLNEVDRKRLGQSILHALPAQTNRRRSSTMARLLCYSYQNIISYLVAAFFVAVIAAILLEAHFNTGRVVSFPTAVTLTFDMPNGAKQQAIISANTDVVVVGDNENARVRLWFNHKGYAFSRVKLVDPDSQASNAR